MVKKRKRKAGDVDLLRIASFILLNTMIFHEKLANMNERITSLKEITNNYQSKLIEEWEKIINEIGYHSIFHLGLQVLRSYPSSPQTECILKELKDLTLNILASGVLLRHDLMGRVYHKLLLQTAGGYYATYYTSVPAATLLAELIIKTEHKDWKFTNEFLENFTIIDPACGSGTLLSALYAAIRDKYIIDCPSPDLNWLHTILLEKVIWGFDVLDFATHLTLMTLALHNLKGKFEDSHIKTLPNGVDEHGNVYLGTLDYLDGQTLLVKDYREPIKRKTMSGEREEFPEILVPPNNFDVVIMNPPFSRSAKPNIKFGYADEEARKLMIEKLKKLTERLNNGKYKGIGKAGLGAYFVIIGDKMLKLNGRMGLVMPRAILSGVSWEKIRELLQDKYEIEYIISNFDTWSWSEDTDLGEVLIIARKTDKPEEERETCYVNIWKKPKNAIESLFLSQKILRERKELAETLLESGWSFIKQEKEVKAAIYKVPHKSLRKNWLIFCLFRHPELNKFTFEIMQTIPSRPLASFLAQERGEIKSGRDIAQIKSLFEESSTITPYPMLWGHQSNMNRMFLDKSFIKYGEPKNSKAHKFHEKNKSNLLIAERPHINTESVLAVETEEKVLATAFWELIPKEDKFLPLLLLWLNSTFGFVLTLAHAVNSKAQIFKLKKERLHDIPIPSNVDLTHVKEKYEEVKKKEFKPYPQEFSLASQGKGVRYDIDKFFVKELNLDINLKPIYEMLSEEPSITLQKNNTHYTTKRH